MKLQLYLAVLPMALLAGCQGGSDDVDPPAWALVNRSKIQAEFGDLLKAQNPYPAELSEGFEQEQEAYERTTKQISQLQRNGVAQCMGASSRDDRGDIAIAPAMASRPAALRRDVEMQNCLENVKADPLLVDLETKAASFTDLKKRRHEHDVRVQKIADETINGAIEAYAAERGFELVISNEASIVYNGSQQVLDITSGVIAGMRKQLESPQ